MALLAGCGAAADPSIAVPSLGGARAAVAGLIAGDVLREARAFDPTVTFELRFEASAEDASMAIAAYDATMAELGLTAGILVQTASGVPLPVPTLVLARAQGSTIWNTGPDLPSPMARARFSGVGITCPTFRQTPIAFDVRSVRYAVEIGADQVLIGLHSGALLALRPGEAPRMVETSTVIPNGVTAAAARADGSVALVSTDCCVYDGVLTGDLVTLSAPRCQPLAECEFVVDAVVDGSTDLVWMAGDGGVIRHTPPATFTRLGALSDQPGSGRVVRDDRGVLYAAQQGTHLGVASPRGFSLETPPILGVNLTALSFVEGVGVLLGDSAGHIVRRDEDGHYEALGDPGFFTGVTRMLALPNGRFWAIGGSGEGAVWHDGEFCPLEQVGAGLVLYAPRFGGGWLFIGAAESGPNAVGIWIRPVDL